MVTFFVQVVKFWYRGADYVTNRDASLKPDYEADIEGKRY